MQDDLFQLIKEQPIDLHSFTSPGGATETLSSEPAPGSGSETSSLDNDGVLDPADSAVYEEVAKQMENAKEEPTSTLEQRIQDVVKDYSENPMVFYGGVLPKRLVTLAAKMHKAGLIRQASQVLTSEILTQK
jgi:hypothetical protein